MLILEGTDLVGKTTLAHKLAKQLKMIYQHIGPLPDTWTCRHYLELGMIDSVRDRYHLSALAYRGLSWQPEIAAPRILDAALVMRHCAFKVIIVAENAEILKPRWRNEELFTMDQIMKVNQIYKNMSVFADHRIVLTETKPYPTNEDLDAICLHYTERRRIWTDMLQSFA